MGKISEEIIRQVVEATDIVDLIGSYIQLKRAGSNYKALCPFHKEKTPSFTVSPSKQMYHCFGCGAGGGAIRFVMDYERVSFLEAIQRLANRAGIELVEEKGDARAERFRKKRLELLKLQKAAADWFHRYLLESPEASCARDFLKKRGIHQEIAQRWKIGFAPEKPHLFISAFQKLGWSLEDLLEAGLCGKTEDRAQVYERFRGRITLPITNDYGEVVGFSARVLNPNQSPAKYVNTPETPLFQKGNLLFGLSLTKKAIADANECILCEGQFDLITAYEHGFHNVAAPQGTAFTPHQAALLRRFTSRVILCFDSDPAGQKATHRSLPILLSHGFSIRILQMPPGDDPDSFLRREGAHAFRQLLNQSKPLLDHYLDTYESQGLLRSPEGISHVVHQLASLLAYLPDDIQREAAINLLATRCRIPPSTIRNAIPTSPTEPSPHAEPTPATPPFSPPPEPIALLCQLALTSPDALSWLRQAPLHQISAHPSELHPLPLLLSAPLDPSSPHQLAAFLDSSEPSLAHFLSSLLTRKPLPAPLPTAQATWLALRRQFLRRQIHALASQLQQPNLPPDSLAALHKELLDLKQTLKNVPST